jgi:hypothetical protein
MHRIPFAGNLVRRARIPLADRNSVCRRSVQSPGSSGRSCGRNAFRIKVKSPSDFSFRRLSFLERRTRKPRARKSTYPNSEINVFPYVLGPCLCDKLLAQESPSDIGSGIGRGMNTHILEKFGIERRYSLSVLFLGIFCGVLGALAALEIVFWAFQTIIRLLTHQI